MANFGDHSGDFRLQSGDREIRFKIWSLPDYSEELTTLPVGRATWADQNVCSFWHVLGTSLEPRQRFSVDPENLWP